MRRSAAIAWLFEDQIGGQFALGLTQDSEADASERGMQPEFEKKLK